MLTQIRFHKNVLKSKGDQKLFAFSSTQNKKRVQHNVETLVQNLSLIIDLNPVKNSGNDETAGSSSNVRERLEKSFFNLKKN